MRVRVATLPGDGLDHHGQVYWRGWVPRPSSRYRSSASRPVSRATKATEAAREVRYWRRMANDLATIAPRARQAWSGSGGLPRIRPRDMGRGRRDRRASRRDRRARGTRPPRPMRMSFWNGRTRGAARRGVSSHQGRDRVLRSAIASNTFHPEIRIVSALIWPNRIPCRGQRDQRSRAALPI